MDSKESRLRHRETETKREHERAREQHVVYDDRWESCITYMVNALVC